MKRETLHCIEFKNGNISVRLDKRDLPTDDEILLLSSVLDEVDCYFIGETFCLNNWETGHLIYNCYSDLCYVFPWALLEDLKAGKAVRLYARPVSEDDREVIERW